MGKERNSEEKTIDTIRRKTRRRYGAEDKMRIVLEGLRGEEPITELCLWTSGGFGFQLSFLFSKSVW